MKISTLLLLSLFSFKAFASGQISNLVEPVKYFVNHESQLSVLSKELSIYKKVGLLGISGIGKTQFARMYAYRNQDKYSLIWFFDCNSDLSDQYVLLAKEINKNFCSKEGCILSENISGAKQSVIKYLTPKRNWLVVFDNIKVNENKKIQDILEWEHNGHVIVNSQDGQNIPHALPPFLLKKRRCIKLS